MIEVHYHKRVRDNGMCGAAAAAAKSIILTLWRDYVTCAACLRLLAKAEAKL